MVKKYLLYIHDLGSFTSLSPTSQIIFSSENIITTAYLEAFNQNDKFLVISEHRSFLLNFQNLNNTEITFNKIFEIEIESNLNSITNPFKEIQEIEYNKLLSSLLVNLISVDSNLDKNQERVIDNIESQSLISGFNKIYFGSPGTGKSHKVDKTIEKLKSHYYERVTFHPEFDNSTFVGGYKPISVKVKFYEGENEYFENEVHYKFVPQAFTNIYERAWQDLDNQYYLVIEEINRGNCAEIFGEIFQLLDRNSNYTVSPSKELKEYLMHEAFKDENHDGIINGLKLPPNLSVLATMNTSDQSLFPMDSAFKRRWDWEYVPICYEEYYLDENSSKQKNDSFDFVIDIQDGEKYSWIKFIEKVNLNHIKSNQSLGMDKCIGNYFIKPEKDNTIALKPFINKVIFYLWNDVFKDEDNKVFEENTSYEDFFPINTNGKKKIKELFDRIELKPKLKEPLIYAEDDVQLSQVAEPQQELESK
ncbi:AAA family ATPase [Flavobacterium sp. I3-2]|uniref:AAA family ATPase n=1 Tax=Flavobacterium sp. I3-2 TaxID=2748319 RepID=UPI0015AAEB9B|nr:AAA family ATPase [Flavobacterium sp. I3-2]